MKTILVTGGTVFVSRYVASYFVARGDRVYVLNRGTRPQPAGVTPLLADRHALGGLLRSMTFDAVLDMTAYHADDIILLLDALSDFATYVLLSSSAVYPETAFQPIQEETALGPNRFWGAYGLGKIGAEHALLGRVPNAYILRPPYLYGPMNNLYREAFVFDCALQNRPFCLPQDGQMGLQFFYIEDLCRFLDVLLDTRPAQTVFNLGHPQSLPVAEWVRLCYAAVGKVPAFVSVDGTVEQRAYFCFRPYEYRLDVAKQQALLPSLTPMAEGLDASLAWYLAHPDSVNRKPYLDYIDHCLL